MNRITIGNTVIAGFVNFVQGNRLIIGTGSYKTKDQTTVYKESISVFLDEKFDGETPAKGDYVKVSGDLVVSPRRDKPEELNATMNLRYANQVVKAEAPRSREAAAAPANSDDI